MIYMEAKFQVAYLSCGKFWSGFEHESLPKSAFQWAIISHKCGLIVQYFIGGVDPAIYQHALFSCYCSSETDKNMARNIGHKFGGACETRQKISAPAALRPA